MSRARSILSIALLAAACGSPARDAAEPRVREAETSPIADAMCREHGVLESLCTKCNPALAAVFRAKGDWCAEHGLPESICPVCHPERGGRPAGEVASDKGPADGTMVRLASAETARMAGLQVREAVEGSGAVYLSATARIVYDATRVAHVNARAEGVVRSISADVGSRVRPGSILARIESAALAAEQSRLAAAESRVAVAEANFERLARLHREGIAPEQDVSLARQERDTARAERSASAAALGAVESATDGSPLYPLTSPIAGIVLERSVTLGRVVTTEEVVFVVADTSVVWAEIEIAETDAAAALTGQSVVVAFDALGPREFEGTLSYLAPEIDLHTRTVKGRVVLANPDGALRANLFGRARVRLGAGRSEVLVPPDAVQRAGDAAMVFVRLADALYETRRVRTGARSGDLVAVRGRIRAGDAVVTQGSFFLKTETLKDSIGAGCCDPP